MQKIKIKEKELRFLVKNILLEADSAAGAVDDALATDILPQESSVSPDAAVAENSLMSFIGKDLETKINNSYAPGEVLDFYFKGGVTGEIGKEIATFRDALIEYINVHTDGDKIIAKPNADNIIDVLEDISSAVGGSLSRVKLSQDVIKRICQEIYSATEGGVTGLGTYKENLASALGSKQFPSFKYSLEAIELEKNYARIASGEVIMFSRSSPNAGLYDTLMDEFDNGSEKQNIRNYVLSVLSGKHYFQFTNVDDEVVDISLENIFEKFIKFAKEKVEGKSSSKNDDGSITLDIESETEEDSEEDSEEVKEKDSSEKREKKRKGRKETYSKIKGEILRAVVPRSIETLPKFEELFDLKSFQRSIVAGMREDRRGFGNGQDFQIEISFKKEEARIERNFSPVGTHRVKIGGKTLRKAIKSRKWRSSLKEVFADALDDALIANGTAFEDLKGLRRFRLRIIVPAGFYELNESSNTRKKVFLKGEDILKIIKTL